MPHLREFGIDNMLLPQPIISTALVSFQTLMFLGLLRDRPAQLTAMVQRNVNVSVCVCQEGESIAIVQSHMLALREKLVH